MFTICLSTGFHMFSSDELPAITINPKAKKILARSLLYFALYVRQPMYV